MLTEERHSIIMNMLSRHGSVALNELCSELDASESTVRRDLSILAESGMLTKVRGGAIALNESFTPYERNVEEKSNLFIEEKKAIARYAASLIENDDFVFIDAGTTTEKIIDFLPQKKITFVTNAFVTAKKLAQKGFRVFIPAGEIKSITEAIIGSECVLSIQKYNFTKCFMGVNGISISSGLTTPDRSEAAVKSTVLNQSREIYILADHSKFDKITSITFGKLNRGKIITDKLPKESKKYLSEANIKEVL